MTNKQIIDVAEVIDSLHSTPKYLNKGYPMVRVVDVNNNFIKLDNCFRVDEEIFNKHNKNHVPQKGDIIITRVGSYGMLGYVDTDKKFCLGQNTAIIHPNKNGKFLYYYLQSPYMRSILYSKIGGSAYKCISLEDIRKLPYNDSGLKIEEIGEFLYSLDAKIELNNKIIADFEAVAKTIYDYWFVQFDFPNKNNRPYKSFGGVMIWNNELKREVPEGWKIENLKHNSLSTLIKPRIDVFKNEKIYLATSDVINNDINFKADKITFNNRESRANMQPLENSIWFAKMKNSKKVLYFGNYSNYYLNNFILSTGFAGIKCNELALEYLWGFINNTNFEFIKDRLANGATQEAINNESMALIHLIIPDMAVLKKYHELTFDIYKKIYLNQVENNLLVELRDWLLPMLMNGQISIK